MPNQFLIIYIVFLSAAILAVAVATINGLPVEGGCPASCFGNFLAVCGPAVNGDRRSFGNVCSFKSYACENGLGWCSPALLLTSNG